jgi:curved DNA-binding protein CbpA
MLLKDYYAILELQPPATQTQIKKAYRRLAHIYHPDKNQVDPYARARFADIKEAYEILTHPERREQYLQQRWYNSSMGKKTTATTANPVTLLKELLALERQLAKADEYRMDREGLSAHLLSLFGTEPIALLNQFGDKAINFEIVAIALRCARLLPYAKSLELAERLKTVAGNEPMDGMITHFIRSRRNKKRYDGLRIPLLLILVALICLLIYFSANN